MIKEAADKDVLVLVHGYNNDYKKALLSYEIYYKQMQGEYGKYIDYIWPGGDQSICLIL